VTTNGAGQGSLGGIPALPEGPYTVTAYFNGTIPLNPWAPEASQTSITLSSPLYNPSVSLTGAFNVIWPFAGFFQPVENWSTGKWNTAKAGQAIPVKFSLGGYRGMDIFRPADGTPSKSYPKAVQVTCPGSTAPTDAIETYATSNGGLQYSAATDEYTYVWKTTKAMSNKCYELRLGLADGNNAPLARFILK
jgi:hypothetical protein